MEAVKFSAVTVCLTLCAVVSFSGKVSGEKGMCGAIVTADAGDDRASLINKALSALRGACRCVKNKNILQTVTDCSFVTAPTPKSNRDFDFILKPLVPPFKLSFKVQAPSRAMILLAAERTSGSVFAEIAIGYGRNEGAFIRTCHSVDDRSCDKDSKPASKTENGLVSISEFRPFWVGFKQGVITVGKGGADEGFMDWNASEFHGRVYHQVHVGIATYGENEQGDWVFHTFCQ